jgi:hypothetical protein
MEINWFRTTVRNLWLEGYDESDIAKQIMTTRARVMDTLINEDFTPEELDRQDKCIRESYSRRR